MIAQRERGEHDRAATGYLLWPLALVAVLREDRDASSWARIHARQASVYGIAVTVGYLALLTLPLDVVIATPDISTGATVALYGVGLLVDVAAFVALVALTFAYAGRASRGELFTIPLVSALTDRVFRLRR